MLAVIIAIGALMGWLFANARGWSGAHRPWRSSATMVAGVVLYPAAIVGIHLAFVILLGTLISAVSLIFNPLALIF